MTQVASFWSILAGNSSVVELRSQAPKMEHKKKASHKFEFERVKISRSSALPKMNLQSEKLVR